MSEDYCSIYCNENQIKSIGTAIKGTKELPLRGFLLVEIEKITEKKIKNSNDLIGEIAKKIKIYNNLLDEIRLQAVIRDENYVSSKLNKIIFYELRGDLSKQFFKREFDVSPSDILNLVADILNKRDLLKYNEIFSDNTDILVCTHALRDKCCGRFGYPIYKYLKNRNKNSSVRIWQSSHLTGHRMAPSILDLRDGRYWGYVTITLAEKVLTRSSLAKEDVQNHYRGLSGLNPYEQVGEGIIFQKFPNVWFEVSPKISSIPIDGGYKTKIEWDENIEEIKVGFPDQIEIGKTKCSFVKPAKHYPLI